VPEVTLNEKPASPLLELLRIAGPTVATMTSFTLMQFTDKWLVSRLGPEFVGAQGNGGLVSWVPQSIAMGMFTVVNTYVSQNMGAGKPERGPAYVWNALYLSVLWYVLFLLPLPSMLPWLFGLAGVEERQIDLGVTYGSILLYGGLLNMWTRAISQFFYGMHKASVVMVAGIAANVVNLIASALLVFGNGPWPEDFGILGRWGAAISQALSIPALGIAGSAYGTILATALELAIPLAVFLGPKMNASYHTRAAWKFSWEHIRDIVKTGWAAGLMFGNEMVCWGYFMVHLVSGFGKAHASAGWIAHQYMSLSFMPAVGLSVAATAIVGKYMGMKRPDIAEKRAWLAMGLASAYMGLCGLLFVLFRHELIGFFVEDGVPEEEKLELIRLGALMLIATACFQLFDGAAMVLSGALRGAGDTVVPGVATVVTSWGIIVGGGTLLIHLFPHLESIGAWIGAAAYIIILCLILLVRFMGGKWKKIQLLKEDGGGLAAAGTVDGVV